MDAPLRANAREDRSLEPLHAPPAAGARPGRLLAASSSTRGRFGATKLWVRGGALPTLATPA